MKWWQIVEIWERNKMEWYWSTILRGSNDIDEIKRLCKDKCGSYERWWEKNDDSGRTLFNAAYSGGYVEITKWLLENGANADDRVVRDYGYYEEETPLMIACLKGHAEIVKLLVNYGARINYVIDRNRDIYRGELDLCSNHCLTSAIRGYANNFGFGSSDNTTRDLNIMKSKNIIKYLIECGADVKCISKEYIMDGIPQFDTRLFLPSFCPVYPDAYIRAANEMLVYVESYTKQTVMLNNIKSGNLENIKQCLANGMDVNFLYAFGITALMWACQKGNFEVALMLISAGANINAKDENGKTALNYAAEGGNAEIMKLLLAQGADTGAKK